MIMDFVHKNKLILEKISTFVGKMTLQIKSEESEEIEEEKKKMKSKCNLIVKIALKPTRHKVVIKTLQ